MLIIFEGPDKTGKSTSAANLSAGESVYNATKGNVALAKQQLADTPEVVQAFDRLDWFTHMVYRLALPEHEWNDERIRTVFGEPEAHLVINLHHPDTAALISDELYEDGTLDRVNQNYAMQASALMGLNAMNDFALFKSISVFEVFNHESTGEYRKNLIEFAGPVFPWDTKEEADQPVDSDERLLTMLRNVERLSL